MARSVEKAVLRLARELRSGRHARGILVLLACIALAQSLLVIHRIDHASVGHQVSCALCLAADHQAGTVEHPTELPVSPVLELVVSLDRPAITIVVSLPYEPRAPPRV